MLRGILLLAAIVIQLGNYNAVSNDVPANTCANPDDTSCQAGEGGAATPDFVDNGDLDENDEDLDVDEEDFDWSGGHDENEDFDEYEDDDEEGDRFESYSNCIDEEKDCDYWAQTGECEANPDYMLDKCRMSCASCTLEDADMGAEQLDDFPSEEETEKTKEIIRLAEIYLRDEVLRDRNLSKLNSLCHNKEGDCSYWAAIGECEEKREWMIANCALACRLCNVTIYSARCPIDPNAKQALEPGDLNALFERLVRDDSGYGVTVHSRPGHENPEDKEKEKLDYKTGPWVITLDSFLTDEECEALIEKGNEVGYERSANVGELNPDGSTTDEVDETRTSENAWCDETCDTDPIISGVIKRISDVTGISVKNQEFLQLLRYTPGQYYQEHHDYIEYEVDRQNGPRILTFFLYLNDVEEGGETKFNDLGFVVTPKKGRAVLWPSVIDEDPMEKDFDTHHEALPVKKGIKYGANAWIHMFDFRTPYANDCS